MTATIDNTADTLDSRDIIARIQELEGERDSFAPDLDTDDSDWAAVNPDDAAELGALLALQDEAEGYAPDWQHGATLIRDSYFEDYARELAEDIGAIDRNATWPLYCIDWEQAARDLKMDYTSVEFGGVAYWFR